MPKPLLDIGLPDQPAGLPDQQFGLVLPLYRAMSALVRKVAQLTGAVQYSSADIAGLGPLVGYGIQRATVIYPTATEVLSYGMLVNLHAVGSVLSARKADNTLGRPAHAIVNATGAVTAGGPVECLLCTGYCAGVSGTAVGAQYWLSTAGTMQVTRPTTAGHIAQQVAFGMGSAGVILNIANLGVTV